jgi:hypothetical protein
MATAESSPVSAPRACLLRMVAFLAAVTAVVLVVRQEVSSAFLAAPGFAGVILCVLAIGIVLAFRQVARLGREAAFANAALAGRSDVARPPRLLAPLAAVLGDAPFSAPIESATLGRVLGSIATRLDEARELCRYLAGLLIFLGLLGTFWGLVATLGTVGDVIGSLGAGSDATKLFSELRAGIATPLGAMGLAFASSLFGLAGSLVLGFLELQVGAAQNRFLGELEDAMTAAATKAAGPLAGLDALPSDLRATLERIAANADHSHARATMVAVADLADGVQKLVGQMRSEQQLIRDWVEAQAVAGREIKAALDRLAEREKEPAE